MDWNINFPHLGIYLEHVGKSISIGGFTIAYYGIVIGIGIIGGLMLVQWQARRTGQDPEMYLDLAMIAVVLSIIGARVYYVVFAWDMYKDDLLSIFNIRNGGLAIYGGVLTAIATVFVFAKVKKHLVEYERYYDKFKNYMSMAEGQGIRSGFRKIKEAL